MCGLNGIFAYHYAANPVDRAELVSTRDHMAARGPDGSGLWISDDGRIGLGHRRLSIIDLSSAGAQPMVSADGKLVVTFNGEIYNYRELRRSLEAKGYRFRSQSDTEVLLHLYAADGAGMVSKLRGMFAFALWDGDQRKLLLARDPYGIKPLYYADDGWTVRFASQVKALLAGGAISREPDSAGVAGFYLLGSVPEPFTTFRAIRALPAGCTIEVGRTGPSAPRAYHSIAAAYARAPARRTPPVAVGAIIRDALKDSVAHHLIADVPVGAFLSAGVDSSALVGLMRDAGARDIETVTIAFEEFRGRHQDEAPLAAEVARHYGTRHTTRVVTRGEFEADLPRIVTAMDQPSIDGINTWFVSKAARELGLKVAISGLGGDELLGGYPTFRDVPRWVRTLRAPAAVPFLGRLVRTVGSHLTSRVGVNPKAAGLVELGGTWPGAWLLKRGLFMPWELGQVLGRDVAADGLRRLDWQSQIGDMLKPWPATDFGRVAMLESALYMRNQLLRDTDWASMAHSLEVRVPLVDSVLLERLAPLTPQLPAGEAKRLLAAAPSRPLPAVLVNRPKTGFTTPVDGWIASHAGGKPQSGHEYPRSPIVPWARGWSQQVHQRLAAA